MGKCFEGKIDDLENKIIGLEASDFRKGGDYSRYGKFYEDLAVGALEKSGFTDVHIVHQETDIVCKYDGHLHYVEVKGKLDTTSQYLVQAGGQETQKKKLKELYDKGECVLWVFIDIDTSDPKNLKARCLIEPYNPNEDRHLV